MAMLYQRARRVARNFHDPDKDGNAITESDNIISNKIPQRVQRLRRSAGLDKFEHALKTDGCVIVKDFTDIKTLENANDEVEPWMQRQKEIDMKEIGWLAETRTITKLMERSPTIREKFYADGLYQMLSEHFLTTESYTWNGDEKTTSTIHPLLSSAITFDMPVSGVAQIMHRDDQYYHAKHEPAAEYEAGRDLLLGLFVPGSDTFEQGSIKVVPGSHLWGDLKPEIDSNNQCRSLNIPMKRGEALIMLGSLYYAIGAGNQGDVPIGQTQILHAMFSCSGVHRQEENPFLTYSTDEVKQFSQLVQERLGWRYREASLGWIDLKSPEFLLH